MTALGVDPPGRRRILPAASIFQGAHEILTELGSGEPQVRLRGAAAVHRAGGRHQDPPLLRGRVGADVENRIERFRCEMRLRAELLQPKMVRLLDSGETADGPLDAVFEHAPGSTLRRSSPARATSAGARSCT
jgi:hypothetical protein